MAKLNKAVRKAASKVGTKANKAKAKAKAKATKAKDGAAPHPSRTVTPYLSVGDAAGAIAWYKLAFGAKEVDRQPAPGGKVMHAHLRIGDSDVFLSDIFPGSDLNDPARVGASVSLHVWSRNVDKLWKGAVDNGAKVTMPLDDQFWGDRYGKLVDPHGHSWSLGWKSKLPKAELDRKREAAMQQFAAMGA